MYLKGASKIVALYKRIPNWLLLRDGHRSWGTIILSQERTKQNRTERNNFKKVGTHPAQGLGFIAPIWFNYTSIYKEYTYIPRESFENEKKTLYKKTYDDLIEQEASDKNMVLKYINQYDNQTIDQALNNNLDKSIQYTHVLKKYIDK